MVEFKSNILIVIKILIYYVFLITVITLVSYNVLILWKGIHLSYPLLGIIWAVLLILALALIGYDCVRVVVQDDELIIYRGRKVKNRFVISDCKMDSKIITRRLSSDCQLIIESDSGFEWLDCSMMGRKRFERLQDAIGFNNPVKVKIQ